ncbi:MAG: DUF697 domain-containing protein [Candidatus Adiutrix sp.]|jgi:uncharacterized membrane protein YcjF (UPF0283 family)|nr:DUF697 domain-containing protein [Candidatus Adiutrix sp.]
MTENMNKQVSNDKNYTDDIYDDGSPVCMPIKPNPQPSLACETGNTVPSETIAVKIEKDEGTHREGECDVDVPDALPIQVTGATHIHNPPNDLDGSNIDDVNSNLACETGNTVPPKIIAVTIEKDEGTHREGECDADVPDALPIQVTEASHIYNPPNDLDGSDIDEVNSNGTNTKLRFNLIVLGAIAVLTAFFGFYISTQAIGAVALAQTMPTWGQVLFLPPLTLCGLIVILVFISFIWSWYKLNNFIQINLGDIQKLALQRDTRQEARHHSREAKNRLLAYLKNYPIPSAPDKQSQFTKDNTTNLENARKKLLAEVTDTGDWIDKFNSEFLAQLDTIADAKIKAQAIKAGVAAMASPLPLLDSILILGLSFDLLKELCKIYNIRIGGLALPFLFGRVIRNAFIADVTDGALDLLSDAVGSSFLNFVGAKVAEGGINAIFMRRLGRSAQGLLRPVKK